MPSDPLNALKCETDFLSGVEAHFEAAKGRHFRGSIWRTARSDESDRLRALMAEHHSYDRERLKNLPANRRVEVHGFEKRLFLWKRPTGVAVASVLNPLSHYVAKREDPAPPVGLGELTDHVRQLVGSGRVPHIIGVCSPTGFTEEARSARLDMENVAVVLIEPATGGGWQIRAATQDVDPRVLRIFDPEGTKQKQDRVRAAIEAQRSDLLLGGLTVSAVARRAGLSEELVRQGFEQASLEDPELRLANRDGEFILFRGAPRQEKKGMSVIDRIRQMFAGDGDPAQQIDMLAERRALLAQRRDRIYEDIARLETREDELLQQGIAAKSAVPRRRLAAQLAQLRKDISRQNTSAGMLNQQINIISTDIHNLTLIQQGKMAELPDTTELTEHAVQAEEMLETLKADSEMVGSLEMGMEAAAASAEELDILREFAAADEAAQPERTAPTSDRTRERAGEREADRHAGAEPPRTAFEPLREDPQGRTPDSKRRQADPEA